jgi:hypothetical protein
VVLAWLGRDAEIRAQKRRAYLCYEFFTGVPRIAEASPAAVAVEAGLGFCPVDFMPISA